MSSNVDDRDERTSVGNGNGNGHAEPDSEDIGGYPARFLLRDCVTGIGLANKRIDALTLDSRSRHEATRRWRIEVMERFETILGAVTRVATQNASVEAELLKLVARAHRQDEVIAKVRAAAAAPDARGSTPESEFMTEAARQGLALAKLDRQEAISARRKRNAALVKVAIAGALALIAAGSSVVTYLLTRH